MKRFVTTLFFMTIVCISLYAQKTEVVVDDFFETTQEGTLNRAVEEAISAGTLSNTVFKLKPYGLYILDGSIITPAGQTLEIIADPPGETQETAPPMICWTADAAPTKTYLFDVAGEIKMKNVWLLWATPNGQRVVSTIRVGDSATVSGGRCEFENVMFDYVNQNSSGAIQPYATHFKGYFKNCYFRNATDTHFRYYSRAVSVPFAATGLHVDSLMFENCTFANIGYVYMQEAGNYGDNVHFNHCTFYNVVMYTLESGWWWKMSVNNSLFINTFMYGKIPSAPGGFNSGTIEITLIDSSSYGGGFGFTVPFTEADRRILFTNNNYYEEQWLIDWMVNSPYSVAKHQQRLDEDIPVPQPMFNGLTNTIFDTTDAGGNKVWPYINRANLDSLDPGFINPPIYLDSLKDFLNRKWDDNTNIEWAWNFEQYATNGGQIWPLVEDLSYTNADLMTAAMGDFPLGDLYHWFPNEYAQWAAQADAENERIFTWLETGEDPGVVNVERVSNVIPSEYKLGQNYPNPFNPGTRIEYSVPKQGYVSLKVYNLVGQEVATLFEGSQQAGNYVATFDGEGLSSGVYMYRLESEGISITKKFVLMK